MFPDAQIFVFGHSHEPVDAEGIAGQRLFNPGSTLQRRRRSARSIGRLRLTAGHIVDQRDRAAR